MAVVRRLARSLSRLPFVSDDCNATHLKPSLGPMSELPNGENLRVALDLLDDAEQLLRQRLRRTTAMSEDEIEARVLAWLHERPGAEHGDAPGRRRVGIKGS